MSAKRGVPEALFPEPLADAHRAIGVGPLEQAHSHGVTAKGWMLDRIERDVTLA